MTETDMDSQHAHFAAYPPHDPAYPLYHRHPHHHLADGHIRHDTGAFPIPDDHAHSHTGHGSDHHPVDPATDARPAIVSDPALD